MKRFFNLFLATTIFLSSALLVPRLSAEEASTSRFETLWLLFAKPEEESFLLDISVLGVSDFSDDLGLHRNGYGGALGLSWVAYQSGDWRFRSGIDIVVASSRGVGPRDNVNVLDANITLLGYVDWQAWYVKPYIGFGGGYGYIKDEVEGPLEFMRGDEVVESARSSRKNSIILVGDIGFSVPIKEQYNWHYIMSYRYTHGINSVELLSRRQLVDISTHQIRIGTRFGF